MKKKYVIITLALLVLVAIGICIGYIYTNNKKKIETDNIKGQYSDVIVTDMKTAKESIEDIKEELKITSVEEEFTEGRVNNTGDFINTYKLEQTYKGLEVYNGRLTIYTDKQRYNKGNYQ